MCENTRLSYSVMIRFEDIGRLVCVCIYMRVYMYVCVHMCENTRLGYSVSDLIIHLDVYAVKPTLMCT